MEYLANPDDDSRHEERQQVVFWKLFVMLSDIPENITVIAELAERSPIIKQKVVTHEAEQIWMYDRTTVQCATFNMRGQVYRGHANATALSSSPVVSALGSESDDLGSSPGRGKALCAWDMREKNMSFAFRLG